MQIQHTINPKFQFKKGSSLTLGQDAALLSNYYPIHLNEGLKKIYQYSIDFDPPVPQDSSKLSDKIVESIKRQLRNKIGFICFKGLMLWGRQKLQLALIIQTEIEITGVEEKQKYSIIIKPNLQLSIQQFIGKDQGNLTKLTQVININTKNILKNIGFRQLDKGKYYNKNDFGQDTIRQAGLSIWRGYEMNITNLGNKLFLKADVCSRVLRIQSLLQTMKSTGKINDKNFINDHFKSQSIITRYGIHRIYHIEEIDYSITPKSVLPDYHSTPKPTFMEYYKTNYQITIKDSNQPLIKVKVRNQDKFDTIYLIPELVVLTGLTEEQRSSWEVMKLVSQKTKLRVDNRIKQTNEIIRKLNGKQKEDLMYTIDQKAQQFPGNIIHAPQIITGDKTLEPQKGAFTLRNRIQDPIDLKQYYFVYTKRGDKDDIDADATVESLQKASRTFGIRLGKPIYISIRVNRNQRLTAADWLNQIEIENKQGKPQFVILYFNRQQMKDKKLYEQLKSNLINRMQLNSQVITKKTLFSGAKGDMSKASKIILQINDKMGHPLYTVQKQHPFWKKNTIMMGGIAVSKGTKGFIASLVGTRNNAMTQNFSDYSKIEVKQVIPQQILQDFISGWLKKYYDTENKTLPSTIILYREGLNQKQAQKILNDQLKTIYKAFEKVARKSKINNWRPQFMYINVNQRTGTRIYNMDRNKYYSNPYPGTIVGSQISKDNSYEFLMASSITTEGTCNMVHYKVAHDSSNQQIPHEAVKVLTYQQCYNYPNWTGSIRFPAPLQLANKLAKLVSTFGENSIDKNNPLSKVDYYI